MIVTSISNVGVVTESRKDVRWIAKNAYFDGTSVLIIATIDDGRGYEVSSCGIAFVGQASVFWNILWLRGTTDGRIARVDLTLIGRIFACTSVDSFIFRFASSRLWGTDLALVGCHTRITTRSIGPYVDLSGCRIARVLLT